MAAVLLFCEYPTLSGGERSMLSTLDGASAAGFSITAAAPPEGPLAEALRDRGVDVLPFSVRDHAGQHRPQDRLREELAALLARIRPDLLDANSIATGRLSGPVVAQSRLPGIAHLRDIVRLSAQAVADLGGHARLLAVSQATRRFHLEQGVDAGKTFALHNGVDLDRFRPRAGAGFLHRELALPPAARLVGTIGQIGLRKGQDVLLRAAHRVAAESADVHWLIVGQRWSDKEESRRFENELHATAAQGLAGRVHFLGLRDDVDRIFDELTLLVHPARQEPLGRVLLEAAASGVPVIATDVGGTPEIFPEACQAARLVPPDDEAALGAAMCELLSDPGARARLSTAARQRVCEAFDARQAAAALVRHYCQVLG
jgi:glycosyltransferase involved in cell wall biosynthesis